MLLLLLLSPLLSLPLVTLHVRTQARSVCSFQLIKPSPALMGGERGLLVAAAAAAAAAAAVARAVPLLGLGLRCRATVGLVATIAAAIVVEAALIAAAVIRAGSLWRQRYELESLAPHHMPTPRTLVHRVCSCGKSCDHRHHTPFGVARCWQQAAHRPDR
tara:strand:- start:63 stop:542 length:480 start_codon:yes stop_codon:yes gene_type:complete